VVFISKLTVSYRILIWKAIRSDLIDLVSWLIEVAEVVVEEAATLEAEEEETVTLEVEEEETEASAVVTVVAEVAAFVAVEVVSIQTKFTSEPVSLLIWFSL